jgi:hypothetical protein
MPNLKFIAGEDLWNDLQVEKIQKVSRNAAGYFNSRELIPLQSEWSRRGILGSELVESGTRGWTLRYDSGIQNWGLIGLDMTKTEVIEFAIKWVSADPTRRYSYVRV